MALLDSSDSDFANKCCCCLKSCCFKEITEEYHYCDQKEVYETILYEVFNVQIATNSKTKRYICEDCITKLREAKEFKKMVIANGELFQQYLNQCAKRMSFRCCTDDLGTLIHDSELTMVKVENVENFNIKSDYSDIRLNIKEDISKQIYPAKRMKKERKCKISDSNTQDINHPSKVYKKINRRNNLTLLRENTLKLLENSNICVFQWNKSRYRCFCCTEPFNDMDLLLEHTKTKHPLSDIERQIIKQQNVPIKVDISLINCKICNETLNNLNHLQNHLQNAHNINFQSPEHLLVPFKIQDGALNCQICSEKFALFRLLNIHMNRHYQNYTCDKCGAGFSTIIFLNLHKTRLHRVYNCLLCGITFDKKFEKRKHDIKIHGLKYERKKRFPCPYCDERFLQEPSKIKHLIEKHSFKEPEHRCRYCSKLFLTKSLVNNHVKYVHLKEKIHECDVCFSNFYSRSDLNRHKVIHSGEKKFSCSICNTPFSTKGTLRRHLLRCHPNE